MSNTNFQELNLNHGFLFPAALEDPVICRLVLECILEEHVAELDVKVEYTKPYNSEFKCIRLDVYAKDVVTEVSYNLEMQNRNEYNLPLRSRYYQAQIDMAGLKPGEQYTDLKPLYVIFICNFDPFDENLYQYTFSMQCEEKTIPLNDGVKRIFLNTKGKNEEDVPKILLDFLGYLNNSTDSYVENHSNEKVREIHERIKVLKKNRNVEKQYMHYLYVDKIIEDKERELQEKNAALQEKEEALQNKNAMLLNMDAALQNMDCALQQLDVALQEKDVALQEKDAELQERDAELQEKDAELQEKDAALQEKDAALQDAQNTMKEMIFLSMEKFGMIPEEIHIRIKKENNISILKAIHKAAAVSNSKEQFINQIMNL